ncbi:AKAP7 2'5' RNA ligase-like domain-containing protein [Rhodocollybia butyracea]|uniref:AKAP7 2'5' RNA ligase-like domain-containing protein n=1 Tax=Rhodocollybia butyracea TaxID=206335 RepID=A0A9P5UGS3_9AGAR|nr:AKAP7 2'5' RNA ligase-like domain-containing protein [Rhodocollybia butyracea]
MIATLLGFSSKRLATKPRTYPKSNNGSKRFKSYFNQEPKPTHFLCLPLGHHPDLQEKVTRFYSLLLRDKVEGIDPTILINPRRLHFTLGVMSLSSQDPDGDSAGSSSTTSRTVEDALELLRSLQPQLTSLCTTGKSGNLQISLERIGAFEWNKGARVLWAGPRGNEGWSESEEEREERLKLIRVAEMVHRTFIGAGFSEKRPLKLRCSIIATSRRKPTSKIYQLFSFTDVLASLQTTAEGSVKASNRIAPVSFGTYNIPEIQLCAIGSHGPEDEYVSLGSISSGLLQLEQKESILTNIRNLCTS